MSEPRKYELVVVAKRCVYLNDYRMVGNKPFVSENLPQHSFWLTEADILRAMPTLARKPVVDPINYLTNALALFSGDPADSDYQRGYEAALRETRAALQGDN